jgi:hypothetical protein
VKATNEATSSRRRRFGRAGAGLAASLALGLAVFGNPAGADILQNCGGGGHTLGFWSNKNGQAVMANAGMTSELAMLSTLNLVGADGSNFDPASYTGFRTWLLSATATNMSNMLSAQLAAMELNVGAGFVNGNASVYVGSETMTIQELMDAANAALGVDGYTPSGDPNRADQEILKNALDAANNNLNFVSIGTECEPQGA